MVVSVAGSNGSILQMAWCVSCPFCPPGGTSSLLQDVERRIRLQHGRMEWLVGVPSSLGPPITPAPPQGRPRENIEVFNKLLVLKQLKGLISQGVLLRGYRNETHPCQIDEFDEFGEFGMEALDFVLSSVDFGYAVPGSRGDCVRFCVDSHEFRSECQAGETKILAQLGNNKLPVELLSVGKGEFSGEASVALRRDFERVIAALGFRMTEVMEPLAGNAHVGGITPSQLLATIILESIPVDEELCDDIFEESRHLFHGQS